MTRIRNNKILSFCKKHNLTFISYNKHIKAINNNTNERIIFSPTMMERVEQNPIKYGFLLRYRPHKNQPMS